MKGRKRKKREEKGRKGPVSPPLPNPTHDHTVSFPENKKR